MRIIAGALRGRQLVAPAGQVTRPTAERLRQALFDMLLHAPWSRDLAGLHILDLYAGTGALGLEALSRGGAAAEFVECDGAALTALRTNIDRCGVAARCLVRAGDAQRLPPGPVAGMVFIDPPYGLGLVELSLASLSQAGRVAADSLIVAELAQRDPAPSGLAILAERRHGAGRVVIGNMIH